MYLRCYEQKFRIQILSQFPTFLWIPKRQKTDLCFFNLNLIPPTFTSVFKTWQNGISHRSSGNLTKPKGQGNFMCTTRCIGEF